MNNTLSSPSRVIKIPAFQGSLSTRAIYIYLPPGYDEATEQAYPVLYMHDGQNCFATYEEDSYAGSWRADQTADRLINEGKIRPCIIVGVSNGQQERLAEYMPPYVQHTPYHHGRGQGKALQRQVVMGRADKTFAYYRDEVDPYIRSYYRVLDGREHVATCGSSMGGLFSAYIGFEESDFACSHAIMSPSFWITYHVDKTGNGSYEMIDRFRTRQLSQTLRLWLDCGSWGSAEGKGDDGLPLLLAARDALISNTFEIGKDFQVYIDQGALHNEIAWADRFDQVLCFLFPIAP